MATTLQGPRSNHLRPEGAPGRVGGRNQAAAPGTAGGAAGARHFISSCDLLQQGTKLRFGFIEGHRATFELKTMCQVLHVSQRGYYAWRKHPESARAGTNRVLSQRIQAIHAHSRRTYGVRRVHAANTGWPG